MSGQVMPAVFPAIISPLDGAAANALPPMPTWWIPSGITPADVVAAYRFADASDRDGALRGVTGPALTIKTGSPGHTHGEGIYFGGNAVLEMSEPVAITPSAATIMVKVYSAGSPTDWRCFAGFDDTSDAIAIQQKNTDGICIYNGEGYDGTHDNYVCNDPVITDGWYTNAGGTPYREANRESNILTPVVRPEGNFTFQIGALNDSQRYVGGIAYVFIYRVVLTQTQIISVINGAL